ncbi:MAG: hypothetical protein RL011_1129 [Pseudomonadota bacterium]|jgi:pimeloyl-ACP methyl ester carboxylesterase
MHQKTVFAAAVWTFLSLSSPVWGDVPAGLVELTPVDASIENVLLIFPGGKVEPDAYQDLATAVFRASEGKVSVIAAKFSYNLPNPLQAPKRITDTLKRLSDIGLKDGAKHLYLVGHSDGGIMGHAEATKAELGGLVLLGSYIPNAVIFGGQLREYPLPTLMMIGERDGHTPINFLARELLHLKPGTKVWEKAVLFLPGANHMQFADGSAVAEDLPPTADLAATQQQVAQDIVDFISSQQEPASSARNRLMERLSATKHALLPFLSTWQSHETVCAEAQTAGLGSEHGLSAVSKVYDRHTEFPLFLASQPQLLSVPSGGSQITVPTYLENPPAPFDISLNRYLAPQSVGCKLVEMSQQSCAAANVAAISKALAALRSNSLGSEAAKILGDDLTWMPAQSSLDQSSEVWRGEALTVTSRRVANLAEWVGTPISWLRDGNTWRLSTAEWTNNDGTRYCKIVSPLRIVEWATVILPKELRDQ